MSVSPDDQKTADLTLQQLRGLRRENAALLEQNNRLFEHMIRLQQSMLARQSDVQALRSETSGLKADVLLLENQNASRHGEVLTIIRRLDEGCIPSATP